MARTKTGLAKFEGKDVASVSAEIRNTGSGLSESMSTDKIELHHGDEVFVVIRCRMEKVRHDEIKDSSALERVHMMKALDATIVDEGLVAELLEAQVERNDEAKGVHKLPFEGDGGDENAEPGSVIDGAFGGGDPDA